MCIILNPRSLFFGIMNLFFLGGGGGGVKYLSYVVYMVFVFRCEVGSSL